jgi:cytochrome c553
MKKAIALLLCLGLSWAVAFAQSKVRADKPANDHAANMARGLDLFKKHVRPVLVQSCLRCHGGKKTEAEFDLSDRERLLHGGTTGPAILPGNGKDSLLVKVIRHAKEPFMPSGGKKLPDGVIDEITRWIDCGAPYDQPLLGKQSDGPSWTQKTIAPAARQFWSFQPLHRVTPPAVQQENLVRTPIDRFILAKQEAVGLQPNPPVHRQQLIRRAYFGLLGLPPSRGEVDAFVNDPAPNACEKLIDRLLASQHYGERWGRHWLDLARFAESHGFEHDYDRPSAYQYRDFVIQAFNADLPYDTFVKWQIAGDELEPDNNLALMATGYLAAGVHSTQITKNEVEKHRYDEMDDMASIIGTSMLGLSVGCARCHDHKYDPIPQRDYYQLLSTFTTTVRSEIDLNVDRAGYQKARAAFDAQHAPLVAALRKFETEQLPARVRAWSLAAGKGRFPWVTSLAKWYRIIDPDWRKLNSAVQDHLRKAPRPKLVKALISSEGLPAIRLHTQGDDFLKETHFLRRGDPEQKEGVAAQNFLQILMRTPDQAKHWQTPPPKGWRTSYRRRALALWLTDTEAGAGQLLARVIVNRLWQHHMGTGLVATPSDFGTRGERPTHPELLDWLAAELIRQAWHLKPIHKLILTSSAYQQSSRFDESRGRLDPDNRLWWRRPPHRLEAEVLRDALLSVSTLLDKRMYGPGTLDESSRRRSIYFTVKRSKLMPMMTVFDAPDGLGGVADRPTSTIAPQALLLMNNPNVRAYARGFARRIAPVASASLEESIRSAYKMAFARQPTADEIADTVPFLNQQIESYRAAGKTNAPELGLSDFCQVLMCMNEFVYVE